MKITFKNNEYDVVIDGGDIILQSVQKEIIFYGAADEMKKEAENAFKCLYPYIKVTDDFITEFIDSRVEAYVNSIAIMGEVTVNNNN